MVDSVDYLGRTCRLSVAAAVVGALLSAKPIVELRGRAHDEDRIDRESPPRDCGAPGSGVAALNDPLLHRAERLRSA